MHGLMHTWEWFWTGLMIVTSVVVVAIILYAAVELARQSRHRHGHPS